VRGQYPSARVPEAADRRTVHDIIFDELCLGVVADASRDRYRNIMGKLVDQGAEGILLGCTEIDLLVSQQDASVPVFDTTRLHVKKTIELALH
jgi:aspartate racemase